MTTPTPVPKVNPLPPVHIIDPVRKLATVERAYSILFFGRTPPSPLPSTSDGRRDYIIKEVKASRGRVRDVSRGVERAFLVDSSLPPGIREQLFLMRGSLNGTLPIIPGLNFNDPATARDQIREALQSGRPPLLPTWEKFLEQGHITVNGRNKAALEAAAKEFNEMREAYVQWFLAYMLLVQQRVMLMSQM